ncbi:MAG: deaminase [Actinomycetota bacterium]|nr:deaminase [Actinomycetota bacterium]
MSTLDLGITAKARPDWDEYFLGVAQAVAARADCRKRQFGAVIVKDRRIMSTGYNGSPPGGKSCLAGECPRAFATDDERHYENCIALHAEQNAIAWCGRHDSLGATLYLNEPRWPCDMCSKLIKAAGILWVVTPEGKRQA